MTMSMSTEVILIAKSLISTFSQVTLAYMKFFLFASTSIPTFAKVILIAGTVIPTYAQCMPGYVKLLIDGASTLTYVEIMHVYVSLCLIGGAIFFGRELTGAEVLIERLAGADVAIAGFMGTDVVISGFACINLPTGADVVINGLTGVEVPSDALADLEIVIVWLTGADADVIINMQSVSMLMYVFLIVQFIFTLTQELGPVSVLVTVSGPFASGKRLLPDLQSLSS